MEIRICENKEQWDSWFISKGFFEFLQSWEWGEFQKSTGKEVLRFQCLEGEKVVAQLQGVVHPLKNWKYLYIPRPQCSKSILKQVMPLLKEKGIVFVRIEPVNDMDHCSRSAKTTQNRQPQNTLILNIEPAPQELLEHMHTKTRYNIRLALKKEVEIRDEKDIEIFWKLNQQTTERDGFKSHNKEYYQNMLEFPFVYQLNAYYESKPIASLLLIVFGKRCTYLHGASSDDHRNVMAPYLLQWSGILFAREEKCTEYDFWGIAPMVRTEKDANTISFNGYRWVGNHKFAGVTRFKVGFGGDVVNYPNAVEIPIEKWKYTIYSIVKKFLNRV